MSILAARTAVRVPGPRAHTSKGCPRAPSLRGHGRAFPPLSSSQTSASNIRALFAVPLGGGRIATPVRKSTAPPRAFLEGLFEDIAPYQPVSPDASLINDDFAPTPAEGRTFSVYDLAALWVGLVVCLPTYYLAGSLVDMGMSWSQGIMTVFVGNLLVLVPMVLNAHGGTKYGLPFPVLSRAAFGIRGANIPSLCRAVVACGWFGIQTWMGGEAIHTMLGALPSVTFSTAAIAALGITPSQLGCFLAFWAAQVAVIWNGIESIQWVERYSAPLLIVMGGALLVWAHTAAGGFGPMLSAPSQFAPGMPKAGQFWHTFVPALTANVGFWATLSLNIPDFTRYAKSQSDQFKGQAIGLPLFMAAFTFLGLAVTSATVVIFGRAISDPIEVVSKIEGIVPSICALVGLVVATLSTNLAANVVAPANAFINLAPRRITFRGGAILTATLGLLTQPWRLISNTGGYIFTWLIGYSALLGPVGGIVIADYFLVRGRQLDTTALFRKGAGSAYWYRGGYNPAAIAALVLGVAPNVPGFLHAAGVLPTVAPVFAGIYDVAWFVGFGIAFAVYAALMGAGAKAWAGAGGGDVVYEF